MSARRDDRHDAEAIAETLELAKALARERVDELTALLSHLAPMLAANSLSPAARQVASETVRKAQRELELIRATGVCLDLRPAGNQGLVAADRQLTC